MRRPVLAIILLVMAVSVPLFAKGNTSKITISGGDLKANIEITDPTVLKGFRIWSGPGTGTSRGPSTEPQSLIMDWSRGAIAGPQKKLPRYTVSFYVMMSDGNQKEAHEQVVQVVFYESDPTTGN